ncbi:MAG: TolC family protein [Treponema sp.]|nr:TolC family protein [Treponema sp.]
MCYNDVMIPKVTALAFCLAGLACFGLSAETISLEQVRTLALANSRSLARHNLALRGTVLDERARVFSNLPSLSLGASASMGLWNPVRAEPAPNPLDTLSAGASFSVSQRIFEGGRTSIQRAINEIASESARQDALAEFFSVLDSADNAFYAVLEAEATLEAEEASLQVALAGLAIAEIRLATGMINQGEFLRAMADKVARENSRNQARRNLSLANARLRSLVGVGSLPPLDPIDFSGYEELILRLGNITDDEADALYDEFWRLLVGSNPALAQAALSTRRAEQNLSMARRAYSPTVGASFSTGLNFYPEFGVRGGLSLSASIPIDFWVIANNVERSRLARDASMLDYISAGANLELELQSALLNVFAFAGSVLHSRLSLGYAERHFQFVEERYRLFQSSIAELSEASTLLINSRNNHIRASYGFLQGLSRLRSLGAIDDTERLIEILMP